MAGAGAAKPLLVGGALFVGGLALAGKELWQELPEPCQVVALHLADPKVQAELGFVAAPWSTRLWHGQVDPHFARLTVPLYEVSAPFPSALPWLRLPHRRSELHASLERRPNGGSWQLLSMLEDLGVAAAEAAGPTPRRTDDIVAAETGLSVPSAPSALAWPSLDFEAAAAKAEATVPESAPFSRTPAVPPPSQGCPFSGGGSAKVEAAVPKSAPLSQTPTASPPP
ncbi:unnamed protein product [Polarella glacialis]|uniref:Mannosyltransferase n=1 Tax=Polarella glacialis TaxID=89957 RepID=A0A813I9X3_POLGL|nr:unnamed protein product [Polarella glacialis]